MADVVMRPGGDDDLRRCADLWMRAKAHRDAKEPEARDRDRAMTAMSVPPIVFRVVVGAEHPDEPLGFAFVTDRTGPAGGGARKAFVEFIAVGSGAQGRGIGASLFAGVMDELRRLRYDVGELHVRIDNARARGLYERYGWRWTGEEHHEDGQSLPDLVYVVDLTAADVASAAAG